MVKPEKAQKIEDMILQVRVVLIKIRMLQWEA